MDPQLSSPITTESARKPKGFKIATIILSILVLGLSGLSVFLFINNSQTDSSTSEDKDSSQNATATEIANSKTYLEELAVREVVASIKAVTDNFTEGYPSIYAYDQNIPTYKPDSAKSAFILDSSFGFYLQADSSNTALLNKLASSELRQIIKNAFSDLGFSDYPVDPLDTNIVQYLNSDATIVCTHELINYIFDLACSHTSWTANTDLDLINALAEAYKTSEGKYPGFLSAHTTGIANSTYEPYQTIDISFGSAAGLFYRTSPESDWVFFTGTQAQISCSDFNSTDLKRAFAGTTCYDESDNSATVQP